jgi:uncharacterized protein YndB with AHSA1/START domain
VFNEITPPEKIVQTFEFKDKSGFVTLQTVSFEELSGGKTRVLGKTLFQSVADRDGILRIKENEADEIYDSLDELFAGTKK